MRPLQLLLSASLCAAGACAAPVAAPEPPPLNERAPTYRRVRDPASGGVVFGRGGRAYAVVELLYRVDECSGAGGEHYVFAVDEGDHAAAAPRLIHGGGHAFYAGLAPGAVMVVEPGAQPAAAPRRHFVAELALLPPRTPFPPGASASQPAPQFPGGWCLDGLPRFSGAALRAVPAADRQRARRLLGEIAANGMPDSALRLR